MSEGSIQRDAEAIPDQGSSAILAGEPGVMPSPAEILGTHQTPNSATTAESMSASDTSRGARSAWWGLPTVSRRLILWGVVVLTLACLARGASTIKISRGSRQERFQKFVQIAARKLPVILYGEDPTSQEFVPQDVTVDFLEPNPRGKPTVADMRFQEIASSSSGLKLIILYHITYEWRGDYWQCVNLNCVVQRPRLSKLDRMNFSAVMEQESVEKTQFLVNSTRHLAEQQLGVHHSLGILLRGANQY